MEDYRKEYKESVSMMTPKTDRKTLGTARAAERRRR